MCIKCRFARTHNCMRTKDLVITFHALANSFKTSRPYSFNANFKGLLGCLVSSFLPQVRSYTLQQLRLVQEVLCINRYIHTTTCMHWSYGCLPGSVAEWAPPFHSNSIPRNWNLRQFHSFQFLGMPKLSPFQFPEWPSSSIPFI